MTPEDIIKDINQLVSLPDAVMRANQLLDSPNANAEEIGEVIGHDPALSAQLLKLVNSAFYNFPNQIDTISRAITLIGLDELRSLIIASTSTQSFNRLAPETIDMDAFWQRSVYCGLVAKKLASLLREENGETLFLTGLLHDIGRLILFASQPELAQQIVELAAQKGKRLAEVEVEVLGFAASEIGAALLKSWQLPQRLWDPVQNQLTPDKSATYSFEAKLLNLALQVTDCVEPELKTGKPLDIEPLQLPKVAGLELSSKQLDMLAMDASLDSFEVLAIINPQATMIF